MVQKYYKTNCEKVTGAIRELNSAKDSLVSKVDNIAKHFNARAMTSTSTAGVRFGGLNLNNYHGYGWGSKSPAREDKILWTTPNSNNISWPRSNLTKSHFKDYIRGMNEDEQKAFIKQKRDDLKSLQLEYNEMTKGIDSVSFDGFFESIGTDWGNLMFSGLNWFEFDGFVYLSSGTDFSSNASEILGSEFEFYYSKSKGK
jgi:hypothetical protein